MSRERAKVLNDEGIAAAQAGNSELAKQKLRAAIQQDPTWGIPWNNLSVVYRNLGDTAEAMRCAQKGFELGAPLPY
jgi:Flp pilus assembly protein TadD